MQNPQIEEFIKEDDEGDTEYKLKFAGPSDDTIIKRTTQMKFRIEEGQGYAFYVIGVQDNGYPLGIFNLEMQESLKVVYIMAKNVNASVDFVFVKPGHQGYIVKLKVERKKIESIMKDVKVILMGQEGVGKSTLIGVMTSGKCDDGKGGSRTFKHKHEIQQGQTTISYQVLGFDSSG